MYQASTDHGTQKANYTHCSSYFQKQIQTSVAQNCLLHTVKSISGGGFTPDPIGGAHSAPQTLSWCGRGTPSPNHPLGASTFALDVHPTFFRPCDALEWILDTN